MRETDPSTLIAARGAVTGAARALIAGDLDVLQASETIAGWAMVLDPKNEDRDLLAFVGIHSDTDKHLIVDSVHGWHPSVRGKRDAEYRHANDYYRERALVAARALLAKLAPPA